jgi:hypothetical protein
VYEETTEISIIVKDLFEGLPDTNEMNDIVHLFESFKINHKIFVDVLNEFLDSSYSLIKMCSSMRHLDNTRYPGCT